VLLTLRAGVSGVDLGYLLHKNPARLHTFELAFGKVHVFYPELDETRAQAALLLDIDPIGLVRGTEGGIDQYVNDRPYVASSFLSVALSRVLGTAMSGKSKERQELADQPIEWEATLASVPCKGGEVFLRALFEPLGYEVVVGRHALDEKFPEWGDGRYFKVVLRNRIRLRDLLTHVYVLVPVLDAEKHYWVGSDEVAKLLRKGEGWLAGHPQKEAIANRYLRYDRNLTRQALARLAGDEDLDPEGAEAAHREEEQSLEAPMRLWEHRIEAVVVALRAAEAKSVVDLGCGEGKLLQALLADPMFERIAGMDVSWRSLEVARRRLERHRAKRIELIHGSLMYRDKRLNGFDAAAVVEVIEHLDPPRLAAFERVVFEHAQPRTVIITTPNLEYNVKFESLPAGRLRHKDHRFEWTRDEFARWASGVGGRFGYSVRFAPVGAEDAVVGPPTQMGVFTR
jgi:3' terminal RNA ribose 2'-O-methyltransferase Hen1